MPKFVTFRGKLVDLEGTIKQARAHGILKPEDKDPHSMEELNERAAAAGFTKSRGVDAGHINVAADGTLAVRTMQYHDHDTLMQRGVDVDALTGPQALPVWVLGAFCAIALLLLLLLLRLDFRRRRRLVMQAHPAPRRETRRSGKHNKHGSKRKGQSNAPAGSAATPAPAHDAAPAADGGDDAADGGVDAADGGVEPAGDDGDATLPIMRWWSRRIVPYVALHCAGAAGAWGWAALTFDCFLLPGGCLAACYLWWCCLRLLMFAGGSRVEARLHRVGMRSLIGYSGGGMALLLAAMLQVARRNAPDGRAFGFCPAEFYGDPTRVARAICTNLFIVGVQQALTAHIVAVEMYPLLQVTYYARRCLTLASRRIAPLDVEALCTRHGSHASLRGWLPFIAVTSSMEVVALSIASALHPHPIAYCAASAASWIISFVVTVWGLSLRWSASLWTAYFGGAHNQIGAASDDGTAGPSYRNDGGAPAPAPADEGKAAGCTDCVVCLDGSQSHLLFPCGHQCVCARCAPAMAGQPCPLCRVLCEAVCKVYSA